MASDGRQTPQRRRAARLPLLALAAAVIASAALAAPAPGTAPAFASAAEPTAWEGAQPALTADAAAATIPASKRMRVRFPRPSARIAGPGALVQVRCTGSSAARCIGTLALRAGGAVHKAPFSIGKGRRQYVVVPLGQDLARFDDLAAARATATASTIQAGGAAVKTKRALRLK